MSSALIPSNASSNFAQQGSVDWVALSNASVNFSVAVLSRLSKAGIDAFTLQIGRAICYNFSLVPEGQERITDAILKLRRYGSYKDIIWFGFGIKEVVTDLADTEEGLTLVALCAALTTTYEVEFSARVLRELCILCKAPLTYTPALRQWKALVELCSGILTSTQFTMFSNGFRRLIAGSSPHILESRCSPTKYTAVAHAILTLARVSRGTLINATFTGALDCAWLAAFAEWILLLDVGICDATGSFIYCSRKSSTNPQVTIILVGNNGEANPHGLLRSQASIIPKGLSLLQKDPALGGVSLLNWQGSWDTILYDVFHGSVDTLLGSYIGPHFATLLKCVSLLPRSEAEASSVHGKVAATLDRSWENHPVDPLLRLNQDRTQLRYIEFAAKRLPQIRQCPSINEPLPDGSIADIASYALDSIDTACACPVHLYQSPRQCSGDGTLCLRIMAETIIVFIWILLDSDIDDDVLPSITGLTNLYTWQSYDNKTSGPASGPWYQSIMSCDYPVLGIDLAFHVLKGVSVQGIPHRHEALPINENLARVGNGICVYRQAVEDPNLPMESISRLRVVRGYIVHSGSQYKALTGFLGSYMLSGLRFDDFLGKPAIAKAETVVQEAGDDTRLEMAYLTHYIGQNGEERTHWLHLPYLLRKLQRKMAFACTGRCKPLYSLLFGQYQGKSWHGNDLKIDAVQVDNAQDFLNAIELGSCIWTVLPAVQLKELNPPSRGYSYMIVMGQPLLLYSLISGQIRHLLPFSRCLTCIITVGVGSVYSPDMLTNVELATSELSIIHLTWGGVVDSEST